MKRDFVVGGLLRSFDSQRFRECVINRTDSKYCGYLREYLFGENYKTFKNECLVVWLDFTWPGEYGSGWILSCLVKALRMRWLKIAVGSHEYFNLSKNMSCFILSSLWLRWKFRIWTEYKCPDSHGLREGAVVLMNFFCCGYPRVSHFHIKYKGFNFSSVQGLWKNWLVMMETQFFMLSWSAKALRLR